MRGALHCESNCVSSSDVVAAKILDTRVLDTLKSAGVPVSFARQQHGSRATRGRFP